MTDVDSTDDDLARVASLMAMDPGETVTVHAGELQRMIAAVAGQSVDAPHGITPELIDNGDTR